MHVDSNRTQRNKNTHRKGLMGGLISQRESLDTRTPLALSIWNLLRQQTNKFNQVSRQLDLFIVSQLRKGVISSLRLSSHPGLGNTLIPRPGLGMERSIFKSLDRYSLEAWGDLSMVEAHAEVSNRNLFWLTWGPRLGHSSPSKDDLTISSRIYSLTVKKALQEEKPIEKNRKMVDA